MDSAQAIAERLEAVFSHIHETRMKEVPILNARLAVEAVGFRAWNGDWIGVLITPWCINLMLLPGDEISAEQWRGPGLGSSVFHVLPAGGFDFLVGEEEALGRFQMCSLFLPVLEFADQEAARVAAEAALEALMIDSEDAAPPDPDRHMVRRAKGDFLSAQEIGEEREHAAPREMNRRHLLTGFGSASDEERPA